MKIYLDITTTILGLLYILLEVRGSLWMWLVGGVMQALGLVLYYQSGLYADCGMEIYYLLMTIYGFLTWKYGRSWFKNSSSNSHNTQKEISEFSNPPILDKENSESANSSIRDKEIIEQTKHITHFPKRLVIPWVALTAVVWASIYYVLVTFTDSNVPLADSFTTALSLLGIWALAHKYLEQWFIWIAVDMVTSVLYFYKGIPFKASLYAIYVIIAVFGYLKWKRQMKSQSV